MRLPWHASISLQLERKHWYSQANDSSLIQSRWGSEPWRDCVTCNFAKECDSCGRCRCSTSSKNLLRSSDIWHSQTLNPWRSHCRIRLLTIQFNTDHKGCGYDYEQLLMDLNSQSILFIPHQHKQFGLSPTFCLFSANYSHTVIAHYFQQFFKSVNSYRNI